MKKLLLVLLALLCIGVAVRFLYRYVVGEMNWRTERAVQLSVLSQAEKHRKLAQWFQHYPAAPGAEWYTTDLIKDLNTLSEDEVVEAKQELLRLYEHRAWRLLSAEETTQVDQWQKDVAAWEAVNVRH